MKKSRSASRSSTTPITDYFNELVLGREYIVKKGEFTLIGTLASFYVGARQSDPARMGYEETRVNRMFQEVDDKHLMESTKGVYERLTEYNRLQGIRGDHYTLNDFIKYQTRGMNLNVIEFYAVFVNTREMTPEAIHRIRNDPLNTNIENESITWNGTHKPGFYITIHNTNTPENDHRRQGYFNSMYHYKPDKAVSRIISKKMGEQMYVNIPHEISEHIHSYLHVQDKNDKKIKKNK
jgi:hypothetical protein